MEVHKLIFKAYNGVRSIDMRTLQSTKAYAVKKIRGGEVGKRKIRTIRLWNLPARPSPEIKLCEVGSPENRAVPPHSHLLFGPLDCHWSAAEHE